MAYALTARIAKLKAQQELTEKYIQRLRDRMERRGDLLQRLYNKLSQVKADQ